MKVLHAIHDFLPRHRAGSEIYARDLCRALAGQGVDAPLLCAEYDAARRHGDLSWRVEDEVSVVEVVNNWAFPSFAESYEAGNLLPVLAHVLDVVQPDVVHLHSLLNLSFGLPALARGRGIPVVATVHDYTLICPSGGQRYHAPEQWVCHEIDTQRCARCFPAHALGRQLGFGRLLPTSRRGAWFARTATALARRLPGLARAGAAAMEATVAPRLTSGDLDRRLERVREVLGEVDCWVCPSRKLASEFERLGFGRERMRFSALGQTAPAVPVRDGPAAPLRVGYVGTLVWHKGVHRLLEAAALLRGTAIRFEIWGDPAVAPDYAELLRRTADGLPVALRGAFDDTRRDEVYAGLDVLVVPSLWLENSPLVVREAQQAGLPVVAARIGGLPEAVEDGKSGLLYDPSSASDLAAALHRLASEPGLWRRLAAGRPAMKTMAEDAEEWIARYREARAGR